MKNASSSNGKTADFESANRGSSPHGASSHEGFAPCPFCKQYSHSIGDDELAAAFVHFQSMRAHPMRGHPMERIFDEQTRNAAQVLMAAARRDSDTRPKDGDAKQDSTSE